VGQEQIAADNRNVDPEEGERENRERESPKRFHRQGVPHPGGDVRKSQVTSRCQKENWRKRKKTKRSRPGRTDRPRTGPERPDREGRKKKRDHTTPGEGGRNYGRNGGDDAQSNTERLKAPFCQTQLRGPLKDQDESSSRLRAGRRGKEKKVKYAGGGYKSKKNEEGCFA